MCNAFNTAKKPGNIREATSEVGSKLIRRTDQAHVKLPTGELVPMKWGFQRKGLGVVNNTRSDNLESLMWKEAIENRRCLIPALSYYEWSGPRGTPAWMAPEMLGDGSKICTSTDVHGLGLILWEMKTAERPYHNFSLEAVCQHIGIVFCTWSFCQNCFQKMHIFHIT